MGGKLSGFVVSIDDLTRNLFLDLATEIYFGWAQLHELTYKHAGLRGAGCLPQTRDDGLLHRPCHSVTVPRHGAMPSRIRRLAGRHTNRAKRGPTQSFCRSESLKNATGRDPTCLVLQNSNT